MDNFEKYYTKLETESLSEDLVNEDILDEFNMYRTDAGEDALAKKKSGSTLDTLRKAKELNGDAGEAIGELQRSVKDLYNKFGQLRDATEKIVKKINKDSDDLDKIYDFVTRPIRKE